MAHIFKHPTPEQKGIIVFTHKEIHFFHGLRANRIQRLFFPKDYYAKYLDAIRQKYFCGIHFGWYSGYREIYNDFDFLMATPSVLDLAGNTVQPMLIPFRSRNFIPEVFQPMPASQKYWDIICVSNNNRKKNLAEFLRAIRHIYDAGYAYRVLLVSRVSKNEDKQGDKFYVELEDDYQQLFNHDERDRFTLIRPAQTNDFIGLPQPTISFFYNSSKVFTLFSEVEGGPKVVSEALLCGLPIVASRKLVGGGLDYLNESNSHLFDKLDTAHQALIDAVENVEQFQVDIQGLRQDIGLEGALKQLKDYFSRLYQQNGQNFDGELINTDRLHLRLPSHTRAGIPWATEGVTADILSRQKFDIFLRHIAL